MKEMMFNHDNFFFTRGGFEVAVLDDGGVGYDVYGQAGRHVFQLAEWDGQHPPTKDREGPHQAQDTRYIKLAPKIKKKVKETSYRDNHNVL